MAFTERLRAAGRTGERMENRRCLGGHRGGDEVCNVFAKIQICGARRVNPRIELQPGKHREEWTEDTNGGKNGVSDDAHSEDVRN
jgi:hypothetical protein